MQTIYSLRTTNHLFSQTDLSLAMLVHGKTLVLSEKDSFRYDDSIANHLFSQIDLSLDMLVPR